MLYVICYNVICYFLILYAVYCVDVACQVTKMSLPWSNLVHATINTLTWLDLQEFGKNSINNHSPFCSYWPLSLSLSPRSFPLSLSLFLPLSLPLALSLPFPPSLCLSMLDHEVLWAEDPDSKWVLCGVWWAACLSEWLHAQGEPQKRALIRIHTPWPVSTLFTSYSQPMTCFRCEITVFLNCLHTFLKAYLIFSKL